MPVKPSKGAGVEWQADFYASCLLMPRKMVFEAWEEAFPDRQQRVLQPENADRSPPLSRSCAISMKATTKRSNTSLSRLPHASSYRPSRCASGSKGSGFFIASFRVSGS
jgi:hypothetical protein